MLERNATRTEGQSREKEDRIRERGEEGLSVIIFTVI